LTEARPSLAQRAAAEGRRGGVRRLWIYIVAPVIGALAGALAYQLVRGAGPVSGSREAV
jgi:glycerol uptake facilitator-like aquaporin